MTTSDKDRDTHAPSRSTKTAEPAAAVDYGNGISPEGVPYQGPSRPREEIDADPTAEDPERLKLEQRQAEIQEQLDAHDAHGAPSR
jgi:hypothetical protein